jgi:hypothetical protein
VAHTCNPRRWMQEEFGFQASLGIHSETPDSKKKIEKAKIPSPYATDRIFISSYNASDNDTTHDDFFHSFCPGQVASISWFCVTCTGQLWVFSIWSQHSMSSQDRSHCCPLTVTSLSELPWLDKIVQVMLCSRVILSLCPTTAPRPEVTHLGTTGSFNPNAGL